MGSDFVRTLRAKGLPKNSIVGSHVMRNSVSPVLAYLAIDLGLLLGGPSWSRGFSICQVLDSCSLLRFLCMTDRPWWGWAPFSSLYSSSSVCSSTSSTLFSTHGSVMTEALIAVSAPAKSQNRGIWAALRWRITFWVPASVLLLLGVIAVAPGPIAGLFGNGDPRACNLGDGSRPPESGHPFGTDLQGCDVYANVIHGTGTSLSIGLLTTLMCLLIAVALGTIAGYRGGLVDTVISRLTDVFLGFPFILGAIIVLNSIKDPTPVDISLTLALFAWPTMSRLVRTSVRSVRQTEYVRAASVIGVFDSQIILRHILPNALGPVLAVAATFVGGVIVAESTLTFLGVGLRSPAISWGLQLGQHAIGFRGLPAYALLSRSVPRRRSARTHHSWRCISRRPRSERPLKTCSQAPQRHAETRFGRE